MRSQTITIRGKEYIATIGQPVSHEQSVGRLVALQRANMSFVWKLGKEKRK